MHNPYLRALAGLVLLLAAARSAERPVVVRPAWDRVIRDSLTSLNVQVCPEPPMRRGSPIHDNIYGALQALRADYNRFQPWFPYPRLTVAALHPPTERQTFWDFTNLDPLLEDFMTAVQGRPVVMNLGPLPLWMFRLPKPLELPADPNGIVWDYSQGTELRNRGMQEAADHFRRGQDRAGGPAHRPGHEVHGTWTGESGLAAPVLSILSGSEEPRARNTCGCRLVPFLCEPRVG